MLQTKANSESRPSPIASHVAAHPLSQHYGSLLHSLRGSGLDTNLRSTIGVTAVQAGAGATTVTLNLGWRAASEGLSVLLVDLDFSRADLTRRLRGARKSPGFVEYLQSKADLDDCVQSTKDEVHFLSPGRGTGLVAPEVARQVLTELVNRYDLVLFDLPPACECGLWQSFPPYFDATLLVLEADREDRRELLKAKRHLGDLGVEITGAVWNKQSTG